MHHSDPRRMGYPPVLDIIDHHPDELRRRREARGRRDLAHARAIVNAIMPPGHTPATDKAETKKHDAANAPAPVKREDPYRPEGFDFQYFDHRGKASEVIPKRVALYPPREACVIRRISFSAAIASDTTNSDPGSEYWS